MSEYKRIYAVDFDGTLAETNFPQIVRPIPEMIEMCKELREDGNILILWTCRCGEDLAAAVEFCRWQGLEFDYINENLPENVEKFGNDSRKIFADFYIEDKAIIPKMKEEDKAIRDVYQMIFEYFEPDPYFRKMFEEIEKVLGFKLFVWQKTFISRGGYRRSGQTTAEVLRELIPYDTRSCGKAPLDLSDPTRNNMQQFYKREVKETKERLEAAGIKTRTVFFTKKEKSEYYRNRVNIETERK